VYNNFKKTTPLSSAARPGGRRGCTRLSGRSGGRNNRRGGSLSGLTSAEVDLFKEDELSANLEVKGKRKPIDCVGSAADNGYASPSTIGKGGDDVGGDGGTSKKRSGTTGGKGGSAPQEDGTRDGLHLGGGSGQGVIGPGMDTSKEIARVGNESGGYLNLDELDIGKAERVSEERKRLLEPEIFSQSIRHHNKGGTGVAKLRNQRRVRKSGNKRRKSFRRKFRRHCGSQSPMEDVDCFFHARARLPFSLYSAPLRWGLDA